MRASGLVPDSLTFALFARVLSASLKSGFASPNDVLVFLRDMAAWSFGTAAFELSQKEAKRCANSGIQNLDDSGEIPSGENVLMENINSRTVQHITSALRESSQNFEMTLLSLLDIRAQLLSMGFIPDKDFYNLWLEVITNVV
jgi:hypothetical protein